MRDEAGEVSRDQSHREPLREGSETEAPKISWCF